MYTTYKIQIPINCERAFSNILFQKDFIKTICGGGTAFILHWAHLYEKQCICLFLL